MDNMTENIATETTPLSIPSPVDLTEARAKLATLHADIEAQEIVIAEGELAQAETAHGELYAKCIEAQDAFDTINGEVNAQTQLAHQSSTRRAGAAQAIDMHRHNTPEKRQANFGTMQRYGDKSMEEWNTGLAGYLEEERAAGAEYSTVFAKLVSLQGERRIAAKTLEDLSWNESRSRDRVASARRKLDAMKPRPESPSAYQPILNGATLVLTSDNCVPIDPRTRVAATRAPGDPI
jgi:hypothetical protein